MLDRTTGTMTILAFGLLFLSILLSIRVAPQPVELEGFQTPPLLLGYQAATVPLDRLSGLTDRLYAADGTLLWDITHGYILTDDMYKQGDPFYTQQQTVIVIFRALDPMSLDAMKALEASGTADPNVYGSTVIADLMTTNKVAGLKVIQEAAGVPLYTDGTSVTLKVGAHDTVPGMAPTSTSSGSAATTETTTVQSAATDTSTALPGWGIALIVLAVLMILGLGWWLYSRRSASVSSTSGLNLSQISNTA